MLQSVHYKILLKISLHNLKGITNNFNILYTWKLYFCRLRSVLLAENYIKKLIFFEFFFIFLLLKYLLCQVLTIHTAEMGANILGNHCFVANCRKVGLSMLAGQVKLQLSDFDNIGSRIIVILKLSTCKIFLSVRSICVNAILLDNDTDDEPLVISVCLMIIIQQSVIPQS